MTKAAVSWFSVLVWAGLQTHALADGGADANSVTAIELCENVASASGGCKRWTLEHLKAKLTTVTVKLTDPVYKKEKSYDGFRLDDILRLATPNSAEASAMTSKTTPRDKSFDEVTFQAKDGYSPNVSVAKLQGHSAVVAYQEHGLPSLWEPVQQGKALLSPAPFYLVWEEGARIGGEYPWPYQLVRIERTQFSKKYPGLFPAEAGVDSRAMKGFIHFKATCLRCHSINLQGGEVGPELNVPRNVTEYWEEATLRHFIHDASSFRARDKMPSFPELTDSDVDQILAYLKYMASHKTKRVP